MRNRHRRQKQIQQQQQPQPDKSSILSVLSKIQRIIPFNVFEPRIAAFIFKCLLVFASVVLAHLGRNFFEGENTAAEKHHLDFEATNESQSDLETVNKPQRDLEATDKTQPYLGATKKSQSDLGAVEKSQSDLEAVEKSQSDLEAVEKSKSDLEAVEKSKSDLEATEKPQRDMGSLKSGERTQLPILRDQRFKKTLDEVRGIQKLHQERIEHRLKSKFIPAADLQPGKKRTIKNINKLQALYSWMMQKKSSKSSQTTDPIIANVSNAIAASARLQFNDNSLTTQESLIVKILTNPVNLTLIVSILSTVLYYFQTLHIARLHATITEKDEQIKKDQKTISLLSLQNKYLEYLSKVTYTLEFDEHISDQSRTQVKSLIESIIKSSLLEGDTGDSKIQRQREALDGIMRGFIDNLLKKIVDIAAAGFHISENQLQVLQITETIRKYSALSCGDVHRYDGKILEAIDTGQARILQSPDENTDEKEQFTSHITDDIGAKILVDATRHEIINAPYDILDGYINETVEDPNRPVDEHVDEHVDEPVDEHVESDAEHVENQFHTTKEPIESDERVDSIPLSNDPQHPTSILDADILIIPISKHYGGTLQEKIVKIEEHIYQKNRSNRSNRKENLLETKIMNLYKSLKKSGDIEGIHPTESEKQTLSALVEIHNYTRSAKHFLKLLKNRNVHQNPSFLEDNAQEYPIPMLLNNAEYYLGRAILIARENFPNDGEVSDELQNLQRKLEETKALNSINIDDHVNPRYHRGHRGYRVSQRFEK